METHRYVRPLASSGYGNKSTPTNDRYGVQLHRPANAPSSFFSSSSKAVSPSPSEEYWTNGRTTLLATKLTTAHTSNGSTPTTDGPAALIGPSMTWAKAESLVGSAVESKDLVCSTANEIMSPSSYQPSRRMVPTTVTANDVVRNSLLAGGVAGICSTLVWCHPFEMARTLMRRQASATSSASTATIAKSFFRSSSLAAGLMSSSPVPPPHPLHGGNVVGGFRALYYTTGLSVPLVMAQAVYRGTVFTVNNLMGHALVDWNTRENYKLGNFQPHQLTLVDRFVCGVIAGAVNGALFVTPVEYVRNEIKQSRRQHPQGGKTTTSMTTIAQQCHPSRSISLLRAGLISVVRNTIRSNGASGFWHGLAPTVLRDSVGWGCFFTVLAYSQQHLSGSNRLFEPQHHRRSVSTSSTTMPPFVVVMMSGGLAGLAFWVWALPVGTMKKWIQDGTAHSMQHAVELVSSSTTNGGRGGLRHSVPLLFGGWQVFLKGAPAAAISVSAYTVAYNYLNDAQGVY